MIYINGNYQVEIKDDGTKIRTSLDGTFIPKRVETLDINLSNKCSVGCSYCYINATPQGLDGDFTRLFDFDIPNYTELAINYNGTHEVFDRLMNSKDTCNWIINLTINSKLLNNPEQVTKLQSWIDNTNLKGIGVSTNTCIDVPLISENIVYHTIAGVTSTEEIVKMLQANKKVLILGYKQLGRATTLPDLTTWDIDSILAVKKGILSFDNLALTQLDIKSKVSAELWENHYMGEEGTTSFYIDLVTNTFSKSSVDSSIKFDASNLTVNEMFSIIKRIK